MTAMRNSLVTVGFACLIGSVATRADAVVTLTFSSPAADQAFAVNANIGYSGSFTWPAGTFYLSKIMMDYVWTNNPNVPPPLGSGVVVTSEQTELVNYTLNNPLDNSLGGSSDFDNPPAPPNPPLKATQYMLPGMGNQTTTYCLRATPYAPGGNYSNGGGVAYCVSRRLGAVQ